MKKMNKTSFYKVAVLVGLVLLTSPAVALTIAPQTPETHTGVQNVFLGKLFGGNKEKQQPVEQKKDGPYGIYDEKTFRENTEEFHEIPFNDSDLEFEILLPKGWESVDLSYESPPEISRRLLGVTARYYGPLIGTARPMVVVRAMKLEHEIEAEHWLTNYILTSGFTQSGEMDVKNIKQASATWVNVEGTEQFAVRGTAVITGNIVQIATFEVPLHIHEYMEYLQEKVISTFKTFSLREGTIEPIKSFTLVDALKFSYPSSWEVQNTDFRDPGRLSVMVHNRDASKKLNGLIRFIAVRRTPETNIQKELEEMKKLFGEFMGLNIVELKDTKEFDTNSRFLLHVLDTYKVEFKKNPGAYQELRFAALGDMDWYIFAFLITPTKEEDLYTWARNTRSFDLILQDLR